MSRLRMRKRGVNSEAGKLRERIDQLNDTLHRREQTIRKQKQKMDELEDENKKLHNTLSVRKKQKEIRQKEDETEHHGLTANFMEKAIEAMMGAPFTRNKLEFEIHFPRMNQEEQIVFDVVPPNAPLRAVMKIVDHENNLLYSAITDDLMLTQGDTAQVNWTITVSE